MAKSKYENYTKEQLIDKIKLLEKQRYGLVWEDKPEEIKETEKIIENKETLADAKLSEEMIDENQ